MLGLLKKTPNMHCPYLSQSKEQEGEEGDSDSLVELDMGLLKVKKGNVLTPEKKKHFQVVPRPEHSPHPC